MSIVAAIVLVLLISMVIRSIEDEQPARLISRKQSRAKRDLRDAIWTMRRRR